MSTYTLAFIVSDFKYLSKTNPSGIIKHRVFGRPNVQDQLSEALDDGVKMLDSLAEYIGIPYELNKIDQFGIKPFTFGAMENWGLVTYKWVSFVICFILNLINFITYL